MRRYRLTGAGFELSRMAYGTWRLLADKPTAQEVNRRLHSCLELGITTIDTAEIYGKYEVESLLGEALALSPGLRERLELVTKAGIYVPCAACPGRRTAHYDATAGRLCASLDQSLKRLRTGRVDLFLVHRPDWLTRAEDTAQGLNRLVREGKIRAAGVSNYSPACVDLLNACLERPAAVNQIAFSLLRMEAMEDGTLTQCERLGMTPMAWSPLAGGRLFDPAEPAAGRLAAAAAACAARYGGATLDQLAYAWILAHPGRPVAIIGTNRLERLRLAAQADALTLDREDWYALWEAAQGRRIP
ncbi:MAG: aldo/keto reductase [Kiritimatiellia bacterium]|jgi:predicted oxidoreductase|nr:aldo/keto reductase [Kiritimatiellia bacterium]